LPRLDPAAAALLSEIASDPRSCLLRIPARIAEREIRSPEPALRESSTWLSRAERELLRVHRCEVASLLRHAYVSKLYTEASPTSGLIRRVTKDVCIEPVDPRIWTAAASRSLAELPDPLRKADEFTLVGECVAAGGWSRVSVEQLVAAAQRLEPRDHGRLAAGVALIESEEIDLAMRVLSEVWQSAGRRADACCAAANLASASQRRGDVNTAYELSRQARDLDGNQVLPRLNLIVFAVLSDAPEPSRDELDWIEDNVAIDDPLIRSIRAASRAFWRGPDGGRTDLKRVRRNAESVVARAGPSAKEVLLEFT
jgi:hypothetical protein